MKYLKYALLLLLLLLSACSGQSETQAAETQTAEALIAATGTAAARPTATPTVTATPTQTPTATEIPPTPTITPTPWALSTPSVSGLLAGVTPMEYIDDPCTYLEYKWGAGKAEPGTIVVPIMFHSILEPGKTPSKAEDITTEYFEFFMGYAKQLGFETITTAELVDFLENNTAIPKYSMILILDDRRPDTPELFMPYLEANDWTLTLAFPTTDASSDALWEKIEAYVATGYVEVQSHGHNHIYLQEYTATDVMEEEIYTPLEVIKDHFGTTAQALIWPGGNFTKDAVQMAREAGFEIGFTVYSRGPLMFNWIPLGAPEQAMDDPLMVLPRAWSSAADVALNNALQISQHNEGLAMDAMELELLYYDLYCSDTTGD
ncbi:MAG: polysaccharide deacetylase family protein [Anaerolineaceae bacterium]|nr:polysaccharide deacetylase family protein [Anaerolineaceae bacterium]